MNKKKVLFLICCLTVFVLAAISLTACLKVSMKENVIKDRLTNAGAEIENQRTSPMTIDGQSGYSLGDILLAKMLVSERVDGEDVELQESLYVIFALDSRSADWVEKQCKDYVAQNGDLVHWNVYRYDNIVMCGNYKILKIARSY